VTLFSLFFQCHFFSRLITRNQPITLSIYKINSQKYDHVFAADFQQESRVSGTLLTAGYKAKQWYIPVSYDRDFWDGPVTKAYEFSDKKGREHIGGIKEFPAKKPVLFS
jgi:hypothetical protein